ncbi:unnamed protein product [Adineta ricciae]|uniref:Uncharacterized protein n=1 Tax=Adineta ricciae TaxID=249248 RepID=A0A814DX45_ADIRI|nr:unnamed protein product [Adineta ricciae]CAF1239729.1 unnamed protein product [Adineta ricciae]
MFRIPLSLPNINVFTFGESSLYGYDSLNHCLIVYSLNDLNNLHENRPDRFHLSSSPSTAIEKLILNPNETILALISDNTVYFVYLPQLINSPSKGSRLCPLNVLPSNPCELIDFLWLSPHHFVLVNCYPSSSECHLYRIRLSRSSHIEFIQTYSVGNEGKSRKNETPTKNISLRQPANIVKLDLAKRKQDQFTYLLLFALKDNGDIYLLEFEQNQFFQNENSICGEFHGPLRILPPTYDNYGSNYSHSNFLCLSCSEKVLILLTRNICQINQCVLLNPSNDEFCLFTIDSIHLPKTDQMNLTIKSMIRNPLNSNVYYVCDSSSNVYSIEISWINEIQEKQISATKIQYLCKSNHSIEQIGLVQTTNKGQWLTILTKTSQNQEKELILLRPNSSLNSSTNEMKCDSLIEPLRNDQSNANHSEFVERIHSILHRNLTLPHVTLSSSSSSQTNLSNGDFQNNLLKFLQFFSEEYLDKQEKVQIELQNKQRYLNDFQQLQIIAKQELDEKFQQLQSSIKSFNEQYHQEYFRRQELSSHLDDLLSIVEQNTPVVSNAEILMHQQLERYRIQIDSLQKKLALLKDFIPKNLREEKIDQSSMENIQIFLQYFKTHIDQMKQQINEINHNN